MSKATAVSWALTRSARNLLFMTTSTLQHAENHMLLLGRKTSLERVAAFFEMDKRLTAAGVMSLPMSRRDIADYLRLTLETVSRAVSHPHRAGVLDFIGNTQREIVLLDRQQLASFDAELATVREDKVEAEFRLRSKRSLARARWCPLLEIR